MTALTYTACKGGIYVGKTVVGIVIAVLASFGFYSLLRMLEELLRPPCPVTTAVLIRTRQELAGLDLFLDEARRGRRQRGCMPQVLIDRCLLVGDPVAPRPDDHTLAVLERFGADWFAVDLPVTGRG